MIDHRDPEDRMSESKIERLIASMDAGEPVLGMLTMSYSPEVVEILAYVGFDFIYADQMFTGIGWSELANMVRAAQGSRMAVFARIENDPWHSGDDPGIASRVARALAVGCDGVKVNVYSKNEARWALDAGTGWHSRPYIARFVAEGTSAGAQFSAYDAARAAGTLIIPSVESRLGIEQVDEMLEMPGLRAFGIAMTDLAIALGHPMQYDHPEVWRFVDRVALKARERGIWLTAGTGYADRTWQGIAERVRRLHDHGVHMIFLQTPEYILQLATTRLLTEVRDALKR
jgi:2-keto-3-deoxy-L-rhamnonate aldolase RhmA